MVDDWTDLPNTTGDGGQASVHVIGPDGDGRRSRLARRLAVAGGWLAAGAGLLPWAAEVIVQRVVAGDAAPAWWVAQLATAGLLVWALAGRPLIGRALDVTAGARDVVRVTPGGLDVERRRPLLGLRLGRRFREGLGSPQLSRALTRLGTAAQREALAADVAELTGGRPAAGAAGAGWPPLPPGWYAEPHDGGLLILFPQPPRTARVSDVVIGAALPWLALTPLVTTAIDPGWLFPVFGLAVVLNAATCSSWWESGLPWQRGLLRRRDGRLYDVRVRGRRAPRITSPVLTHVGYVALDEGGRSGTRLELYGHTGGSTSLRELPSADDAGRLVEWLTGRGELTLRSRGRSDPSRPQ